MSRLLVCSTVLSWKFQCLVLLILISLSSQQQHQRNHHRGHGRHAMRAVAPGETAPGNESDSLRSFEDTSVDTRGVPLSSFDFSNSTALDSSNNGATAPSTVSITAVTTREKEKTLPATRTSGTSSATASTNNTTSPQTVTVPILSTSAVDIAEAVAAEAALSTQEADNGLEPKVYTMTKCHGAGCPYTASWLVHANLFRKAHWYLDSTKMEAASFQIFDAANLKFQIGDPDAYFVHHMSMFEHLIHRKYGFQEAQNKTLIMSKAAVKGECGKNLSISNTTEFLSLIPFYGGLPPNVTADFSAVKSLGQGNSLVDASTKVLQLFAAVCSCLRYFGRVTIGTARPEDRTLVENMLAKLPVAISQRVGILLFRLNKPAHLPFHLLAWGQNYIQKHNCNFTVTTAPTGNLNGDNSPKTKVSARRRRRLLETDSISSTKHSSAGSISTSFAQNMAAPSVTSQRRKLLSKAERAALHANTRAESVDSYRMCSDVMSKRHHGTPIQVVYFKEAPFFQSLYDAPIPPSFADKKVVPYPIQFVYYSESDQIVRFDTISTFKAVTTALNDSTFFTGRRREKVLTSDPADYMGSLNNWRNCGNPGFSLSWPKDFVVRID